MLNIIEQAHVEWQEILERALSTMNPIYLNELLSTVSWLPGMDSLLAAFSLPLSSSKYILFGESPYPREASANGYAFWDKSVGSLWSDTGLSKEVNRATSLRNLIKMLLASRGDLGLDVSQEAIANLDKSSYVQTAEQLFNSFLRKGVLLLNASLVYSPNKVLYHARQWRPFIHCLLCELAQKKSTIELILLGKIAMQIPKTNLISALVAEHPYNISFITNPLVRDFFNPMDLLSYYDH
jgi:uracil-DNA glycosylase